jgi:hypothetical protein
LSSICRIPYTALRLSPEIFCYFFQVLPDRETLGAFLLTFPAFLAERCIMRDSIEKTPEEHGIYLPGLFRIVIHMAAVVILETLGDTYAMRAWCAIPAAGTGDLASFLQLGSDLSEQGDLGLCERTGTAALRNGNILPDLLW